MTPFKDVEKQKAYMREHARIDNNIVKQVRKCGCSHCQWIMEKAQKKEKEEKGKK